MNMSKSIEEQVFELGKQALAASRKLALLTEGEKNAILLAMPTNSRHRPTGSWKQMSGIFRLRMNEV